MIIDYDYRKLYAIGETRGWFTMTQQILMRSAKSSLFDRTGTLDTGVPLTVLDPIPSGTTEKSLKELCAEEAQRIKDLNRPVTMYWSGGIDSTLALVSLLQAGVEDITVALSAASVLEYPLFYREHIEGKLKQRRLRPSIIDSVKHDDNEIIVTGEFGDQMNGSIIMFYDAYKDVDLTGLPWKDSQAAANGKRYVELMEPQVLKAPFEIVSSYDFMWWLNFSCKWQTVLVRMGGTTQHPVEFADKVRHFFRHDDFQRWSMNEDNHRRFKYIDMPATYKHHMKQLIADFTHDEVYQQNKLKVGSLRDTLKFFLKLDDGEVVTTTDDADRFDELFITRNFPGRKK